MIKVFIPIIKGRLKTSIRGFWRNTEGKTYYDYLKIEKISFSELTDIKRENNQEALFYINGNNRTLKIGCIYHSNNNIELLEHRIYKEILKANLKIEIKEALKVYSGITIYKINNKYYKEIFYK